MPVNGKIKSMPLDIFSPICRDIAKINEEQDTDVINTKDVTDTSRIPYSINDISTWIGGIIFIAFLN